MKPAVQPEDLSGTIALQLGRHRRAVRNVAIVTSLVLLVAHLGTSWVSQAIPQGGTKQRVLSLFNMDNEVSVPTWWSQTLLLAAAVLMVLIAVRSRRVESNRRRFSYWIALAIIMLFFSIDEGAAIHEIATAPIRRLFNIGDGALANAWVVLGLAVVATLVLVFLRFFLGLPKATRRYFAIALGVYLFGAVGFEMVAAYVVTVVGDTAPFTVTLLQGAEEFLEMLGATLFISAGINYVADRQGPAAALGNLIDRQNL